MLSLCPVKSPSIVLVFRSNPDSTVNMNLMQTICVLFCFYEICNSAYIFGWMLHNPIPDDMSLAINDKTNNSTHSAIKCKHDNDCEAESDMYCDFHYGRCDYLHSEGELCRRDGQCVKGLICIFGKCEPPSKPGHKGSRCSDDSDCKPNLCCARQHGEKICKSKLQRGHRCYVPLGGLDYSLNQLCPCDEGLECLRVKPKNKRKSRHWQSETDQLRCTSAGNSKIS